MKEVDIDYDCMDFSYTKVGHFIYDGFDLFIPTYELFVGGDKSTNLDKKFLSFCFLKFENIKSIVWSGPNPYPFFETDSSDIESIELLDSELFLFGANNIYTNKYFECEIYASKCSLLLNVKLNLEELPPTQRKK